jgi:hypothetical protein
MSQRVYVVSQQLIANNIDRIAAGAWKGYQEHGRGVIFIEGGSMDRQAPQGNPMVFLTPDKIRAMDDGWLSDDLAGAINIYNPETEVIVLINWQNEVGIYRIKPPKAPKAVAEAVQPNITLY